MFLHGGTIHTLEPGAAPAAGLALRDGHVAGEPGPDARRIDLHGACVIPGLADAHVHFPTWSLAQRQVRLEGARTLGEAA